jgi:hemolysin activation/secretion protein
MNMRLLQAYLGRALLVVVMILPIVETSEAVAQDDDNQYLLQVGAFADSTNASRLVEDMRSRGFSVRTESESDSSGQVLTIVLVGPYENEPAALSAREAILASGGSAFVRTGPVSVAQPAAASTNESQTDSRDFVDRSSPRVRGYEANLAQDQAQLMAQAQQELFEVPPVVERPLGMEEGPRVVVRRFNLEGAVDREKQDIRLSDLQNLLAGHVRTQPPEGYTISQLQAIADEVSLYYRERGLFIAQAIVPAQEVRDGVVTLRVLEGTLGEVRVENNVKYKAKVIEGPFRRLRGNPVTQDGIESALSDVQDFPGLTVFGTLTQGEELGNTDLIVRVQQEDRFSFTPSVDNYGSEFTGEYRAMLDFKFNNLFGVADRVNGYILQTFEPDNGTYGGLNLNLPFGRNAIGFGGSVNSFDIGGLEGLTALGVESEVERLDLYWDRTFANSRYFGATARLNLATKRATTEIPGFESSEKIIISEDKLAVASLTFDFLKASRKGRGITVGSFVADVGMPDMLGSMDGSGDGISSRTGGDNERAGGSFEKYSFKFQHLRRLSENISMLFRADAQYTNDILVALEQYSIGGPQNVRAYPVAEALVDSGASGTVEFIFRAPGFADKATKGNRTWGEIFQVSLYGDYAWGETNNPRVNEEPTVDYSGYGLGLQFNVPEKISDSACRTIDLTIAQGDGVQQ